MTDHHVHIGQFEETYYDARSVFEAIFSGGIVKHFVYSSTTSCVTGVRYTDVAAEIEGALKLADCHIASPLFWFIPDYIAQNIDIEQAMKDLPYGGFKLHPFAQKWTFHFTEDGETANKQMDVLHTIFDYTEKNNVNIHIHTGESGSDSPRRFEPFFQEYPGAKVILAHGRPADDTAAMMSRYPNVFFDTAFMDEARFQHIADAGFASRALTGSDFPITHFFAVHHGGNTGAAQITLGEQYKRDTAQMAEYQKLSTNTVGGTNALPSKI